MKKSTTSKNIFNAKEKQIIALLLDENDVVSSLAIKEILTWEKKEIDDFIVKLQDREDGVCRKRVHQLSTIHQGQKRLLELEQFIKTRQKFILWHKLWEINDLQQKILVGSAKIGKFLHGIISNMKKEKVATFSEVASFLQRNQINAVSRIDNFDSKIYTINSLIDDSVANDVLICALIQFISYELKVPEAKFGIYKGICGMMDEERNWLSPSDNWQITKLDNSESVRICSAQEYYKLFISLKIMALLTEGNIHEFAFYGEHLARIRGNKWQDIITVLTNEAHTQVPYHK